jgi:hypothetical protein
LAAEPCLLLHQGVAKAQLAKRKSIILLKHGEVAVRTTMHAKGVHVQRIRCFCHAWQHSFMVLLGRPYLQSTQALRSSRLHHRNSATYAAIVLSDAHIFSNTLVCAFKIERTLFKQGKKVEEHRIINGFLTLLGQFVDTRKTSSSSDESQRSTTVLFAAMLRPRQTRERSYCNARTCRLRFWTAT